MRAIREWEEQTGERAGFWNPKYLEFVKNLTPLNHPIAETPEPKVPLPEPKKASVKEPVRETDKEDSK